MNTSTTAYSHSQVKKWLQGPVCAVLIGLSGALFAQEMVAPDKPAMDKDSGLKNECSTQLIVDQAQSGGGCEVEKGDNYTKISAANRIVALLPEKISNASRCQEVLETVKAKCSTGDDQLTPDERSVGEQEGSDKPLQTLND